jgi:hypothetical protein
VWDSVQKCMIFLVFDVVSYNGKSTRNQLFTERYKLVNFVFLGTTEWRREHATLESENVSHGFVQEGKVVAVYEDHNPLFLCAKQMVTFALFGSLQRSTKSLAWKSDGFIFTPVKQVVQKNSQADCFKWKYAPAIDITLQGQNLFCQDGMHLRRLDDVFPNYTFELTMDRAYTFSPREAHVIEVVIKVEERNDGGKVIKCKFERFREDKNAPNFTGTIQDIIKEVQESITIKDLQDASVGKTPVIDTAM